MCSHSRSRTANGKSSPISMKPEVDLKNPYIEPIAKCTYIYIFIYTHAYI